MHKQSLHSWGASRSCWGAGGDDFLCNSSFPLTAPHLLASTRTTCGSQRLPALWRALKEMPFPRQEPRASAGIVIGEGFCRSACRRSHTCSSVTAWESVVWRAFVYLFFPFHGGGGCVLLSKVHRSSAVQKDDSIQVSAEFVPPRPTEKPFPARILPICALCIHVLPLCGSVRVARLVVLGRGSFFLLAV